jgi:hypothetical protein
MHGSSGENGIGRSGECTSGEPATHTPAGGAPVGQGQNANRREIIDLAAIAIRAQARRQTQHIGQAVRLAWSSSLAGGFPIVQYCCSVNTMRFSAGTASAVSKVSTRSSPRFSLFIRVSVVRGREWSFVIDVPATP